MNSEENLQLFTTVTLLLETSEIILFDFEEESKLTFENVPTMSWIQSTEISGELLFSQLLDSFLENWRDFLQKMAGLMLPSDF